MFHCVSAMASPPACATSLKVTLAAAWVSVASVSLPASTVTSALRYGVGIAVGADDVVDAGVEPDRRGPGLAAVITFVRCPYWSRSSE